MKALLLLAGKSRRFWPLHDKSLFPLCGKPLLAHQLDRLKAAGISDITLVGGAHNLANVRSLFPTLPVIEQENLGLGMRGALLSALPNVRNEPVLIVSGNDVIAPEGYRMLLEAMKDPSVDGVLLASRVQRYFPGGYLRLDHNRVTGIVEKPGEGKEPSDLVTIVAHIHRDPERLLKALQETPAEPDDGYERALAVLFQEKNYQAVAYEGPWHPVKYPWHLLPLLEYFLADIQKQEIHPSVQIHPSAVIQGNVRLEEGVRVFPHATIVGPCTIGKHTIVANNALVRMASIGNDCVIGYSTEVKSCALASHVWTHMTYLGDSLVDHNVSFGGGTVTGNLRLDEAIIESVVDTVALGTNLTKFGTAVGENCRLGIHTTLYPGVKVGHGSFVASGVLLSEDVPDKSFASMKEGKLVIRPNRTEVPSPEAREAFRKKVESKA